MQFLIDVLQVGMDGMAAEGKMSRDFLGGVTFGKLLQDGFLAQRKLLFRGHAAMRFVEGFNNAARDLAAHRRAAEQHFIDGAQNLVRCSTLEQVATGPGLKSTEDPFVVFVDGEDEYPQLGA